MKSGRADALAAGSEIATEDRIRRQIRLAVAVGIITVLGTGIVGWIAYERSRAVLIDTFLLRNLERAEAQVAKLDFEILPALAPVDDGLTLQGRSADERPELDAACVDEAFAELSERYRGNVGGVPGEYLCAIRSGGELAIHTARPELVGRKVAQEPFRGGGDDPPKNLFELIREHRSWSGLYRAIDGTPQIAAFAFAPRSDALIAIHVPLAAVEAEIRSATMPWTVGLVLIAALLLPASIFLLHRAYSRSDRSWRGSQQALRESEARLHAAVESLPFDFWMLDAQMRCVMQNSASRRTFGQRVGRRPEEMGLSPEVVRRWGENNARAFAGEVVVDYNDEPGPDGSERRCKSLITPVHDGDRKIGILGINIDVSDLHRAEDAQRRLAQRLRILRDIDKAALSARSLQEIADHALRELERLHGLDRISLLLHEGDQARLFAGTGRIAGAGPPGSRWNLRDVGYASLDDLRAGRPNEVVDLDLAGPLSPLLSRVRASGLRAYLAIPLISQGELFGTLNIAMERCGRVDPELREVATEVADMLAVAIRDARLDEKLLRQAAELEQRVLERTRELSAANVELESYVHTVSHDLRAPLRAIEGFAQAVREDCADKLDPQSRVYLERMIEAARRMDRLMLDLLDYSRLGRSELDLQPVDTAEIVADARALLAGEFEQAGAVVAVGEPLLSLLAHAPMLVQAVANLLANAAKFVAPDVTPLIRVWTERRGAFVRLSVSDNGIGIAPDEQANIFQVFERLHGEDAYPGTGIGLAIVRRAGERMHGRVGVESAAHAGSTFWIELPAAPEPT